jgi:hypothetical protein
MHVSSAHLILEGRQASLLRTCWRAIRSFLEARENLGNLTASMKLLLEAIACRSNGGGAQKTLAPARYYRGPMKTPGRLGGLAEAGGGNKMEQEKGGED